MKLARAQFRPAEGFPGLQPASVAPRHRYFSRPSTTTPSASLRSADLAIIHLPVKEQLTRSRYPVEARDGRSLSTVFLFRDFRPIATLNSAFPSSPSSPAATSPRQRRTTTSIRPTKCQAPSRNRSRGPPRSRLVKGGGDGHSTPLALRASPDHDDADFIASRPRHPRPNTSNTSS